MDSSIQPEHFEELCKTGFKKYFDVLTDKVNQTNKIDRGISCRRLILKYFWDFWPTIPLIMAGLLWSAIWASLGSFRWDTVLFLAPLRAQGLTICVCRSPPIYQVHLNCCTFSLLADFPVLMGYFQLLLHRRQRKGKEHIVTPWFAVGAK